MYLQKISAQVSFAWNSIVIWAARRREIYLLTYLRFTLLLVCWVNRATVFRSIARGHAWSDTVCNLKVAADNSGLFLSSHCQLTIISDKIDWNVAKNYRLTSRLACVHKLSLLGASWWQSQTSVGFGAGFLGLCGLSALSLCASGMYLATEAQSKRISTLRGNHAVRL